MTYRVLDLYKDLPQTNCGECEKPGCMPFAFSVFNEGVAVSGCPYLDAEQIAAIEEKLGVTPEDERGERVAVEQALAHLTETLRAADLRTLAANAGVNYSPGPPESVALDVLGRRHVVTKDAVTAPDAEPTVWEKVFVLIYLTRASGAAPKGKWVAYRELPNTTSKVKQADRQGVRIASAFAGKTGTLAEACAKLGGSVTESESADLAIAFIALPRVPLLLLFWDGDEDFGARASMLVDETVLDYLDQEAIVFLYESLAARLLGEEPPTA